ncbi:helix-turn-helix domain-containing protein [Paenibacillus albus]|uniref:AraC family transcriptional regulator n=1 Tax=Paenibacillus albus TaxID=2495582 RepID=A0A3Q8X3E7_9BACL|nr:helix-turn-helix domain-containing protein [Paenibacillus albus]AZN39290.1 AraC family transcriptional regulator [Paenibacillus albus]
MNSSWFRKLLLSYLPVFFVVVTILFFVFFQSLNEQNRKEAIKANEFLTQQVVLFTDNSLKTLNYQVLRDTLTADEIRLFFATDNSDVYRNIEATKLVEDWKLNNPIIDSVYLIRLKDNFVLGSGAGEATKFEDQPFIQPYISQKVTAGKWTGKRSFRPYASEKPTDVITLVQGYPHFSTTKSGYIVVNVSLSKLQKSISPMYNPKLTYVRVTDEQGAALMSDSGADGKNSVLSHYISPYTGWTVESGPTGLGLAHVALNFYNIWVIIALIAVLLGVFWVIHVTRRNYKPISQLVSLIRTSALINPYKGQSGNNEFGFIQGALEQLLEETSKSMQQNQEAIILRKKHRFQEAVLGHVPIRESEWMADLLALQVNPVGVHAFVLAVEIDRYHQFTQTYHGQDQSILKFVVSSVTGEMAGLRDATTWAEWITDRRLSAIIWVPDDADGEELSVQIGEQIVQWVESNLSFTVTIGVHGIASNLEGIRRSHEIAGNLLQYKAVLGTGRLLLPEQLEGSEQRVHDYFGTIHALSQSVRIADGTWQKHIEELFSQMQDSISSRKEIESFLQFLHQQLNRVFLELSKDYRSVWKDSGAELLELGLNWETLDELKRGCLRVFEEMASKLQALKDSQRTRAVISDIRTFIEENYHNPELSLDYLSDQFMIHAKNISKLFKEAYGYNFVDFLIGLRMDKAKQLLLTTERSLQEISTEVGYFNYNSFNRAFKNVAGVSPSDYRKQQTS